MRTIAQRSNGSTAKLVAVYYVLTIALGVLVLLFHGRLALTVDLAAGVLYITVTTLFYGLSKQTAHAHTPRRRN